MDATLATHAESATSVASYNFERLNKYYPSSLLEKAKVVVVPTVPRLPVAALGLREGFEEFEEMNAAGMTFKDTYFLNHEQASLESLHFHELVHVVQWDILGVDSFI